VRPAFLKKYFFVLTVALLVCMTAAVFTPLRQENAEAAHAAQLPPSSSMVMMESSTGRVLYSQDAFTRRRMASTTKIMTALIVLETCKPEEIVTVDKRAQGVEGSSIYLRTGDKLSVEQLLYGLMLRSGNDCAVALAIHTAGSVEDFAKMMNAKAQELGLKDTSFKNPHGLDDEDHYTTAYDLAVISCCAMRNPHFRTIVSTSKFTIPAGQSEGDYQRILFNKNKMLNLIEGGNGIKTGYTKKAGRCLVSSCKRGELEAVCVVLNCGPMFEISSALFETMYSEYSLHRLLDDYQQVCEATPPESDKPVKLFSRKGFSYPLKESEIKNISTRIEVDEKKLLDKPNPDGVGKIKIYYDNNLIFSQKLYTIYDVEDKNFLQSIDRVLQNYFLRYY